MASNREIIRDKIRNIRMGDEVTFTWKSGEYSHVYRGTVEGWSCSRNDHRDLLLVDDGRSVHERAVPLSSVISRKRVAGADKGVMHWHQDDESGKMSA